jgi:O-succinylbenzoic acid--CoA ligase
VERARDQTEGRHVSLVPALLLRLLDAAPGTPPPSTLRAVLLGGGEIPPTLVGRALEAGWPVVPTYGLSEAGSGVTALATVEAARYPASAGRALPGVELRIADPDATAVGEIEVRSPALFDGYLDDPVAAADATTAGGWLRTGDLGRLDDGGRLFVLDRRTDRIVRGGENISPAEVEAALLEHPALADAAVVARRDPVFGHVPVAAIVLREGREDPGDEAVTAFLAPRVSRFKLPVAFVRLAVLPRTPGGKLRRAAVRALLDPAGGPPRKHRLERPGGVTLAYRTVGTGPMHVLLLHGTLSTAGQLTGLARALAHRRDR